MSESEFAELYYFTVDILSFAKFCNNQTARFWLEGIVSKKLD